MLFSHTELYLLQQNESDPPETKKIKASCFVARNTKFGANFRSFIIKSEQTRINTSVDAI